MKRVLLVTPDPTPDRKAWYGGGHGGYVRMSNVLLQTFDSDDFELVPCYHSVRRSLRFRWITLPIRLIKDALKVGSMARKADGIHLVLQYRLATPREFAIALASKWLRCPLLVDIRAGAFETWYRSSSSAAKKMIRFILSSAKLVSVEGSEYIDFVRSISRHAAVYLPNFVPSYEVPDQVSVKCHDKELKVLFVGYAYDGKGVYELIEGCEKAASHGTRIRLSIAGREAEDLTDWLTGRSAVTGLQIDRLGPQSHDKVIEGYKTHDLFCLPTRHPGEGHSNSLNEAMMMGMVIVTTRHGFIPSVIDESACYFVEKGSVDSIAEALKKIDRNRDEARSKAAAARAILLERYSSDMVIPRLEQMYRQLTTTT